MLLLKVFKSMGNQGKELYKWEHFLQIRYQLYFNGMNQLVQMIARHLPIHRKQFSERTIITVMNVNLNAVLQTWQWFLFDSYFCPRFNLFFLLMVVVRCVLARLGILLVGKSGSVVCRTCLLSHFIKIQKICLVQFLNKVKKRLGN